MKEQINDYLHYLNIERDCPPIHDKAMNVIWNSTCIFYRSRKIASWQDVDRFLVIRFLEKLHEEKKATATVTRMISSLRRFHQFLRQERITDHDPMQHIDTPKKAQKLPSTLTLTEVES